MMNEWQLFKFGEVAEFLNGRAYKAKEFKEEGTPIVRIQNLTGTGNTVYSDLKLPENKYIDEDNLIYAWSATFGPYIWKGPRSIYHYHIWKIQCDKELLNKYFFYYHLLNVSDRLKDSGNGTLFVHITKGLMESFEILLPSLKEQEAITAVLASLDNKIDLLHRQNKTLEALAQTLFRHWFIDGANDDWEVMKLGDFFPVITGKKDANFSTEDGEYPFFTCAQKFIYAPSYSFDGKAILLAGNGDFNVKRYDGKFEAYQRTYVLIPHDDEYFGFLYTLIKFHLQDITGYARGSVIRFITKGMITDFEFLLPTHKLEDLTNKLETFNKIFDKVDFNDVQIGTLEKLRDTLLPKLMSGEVRVRL